MNCPNNHQEPMQKALFHDVEVDYCPECLGVWFDKDELRYAKDDKDKQLNWVDFDIWRDKGRFEVLKINKRCPVCQVPFIEVNYGDSKVYPAKSSKAGASHVRQFSGVKIDFCKHCQGVWLDRGEFK